MLYSWPNVGTVRNIKRGGGGTYFYELLMALINGTFLRKINLRGSYEKIIRFYFLYELLNESLRKYRKFMGKFFI